MISVLLADDQALVRAGFRHILDGEPDIQVIGEAADGIEAARMAAELAPDVVLMDIQMPHADGIEATKQICADAELRELRVLILTTFDVDDYVYAAIKAGASGFLVKDTEPAELIHAVRVLARGDALLAPSVTRRLIAEFASRLSAQAPQASLDDLRALTGREREILRLIATGLSNAELSEQLQISKATVKTHVSRILAKVDARDRAQLVVLGYESGLVRPGWLG